MSLILFTNNASTTLAGAISTGSTSINLAAGTGALFPNPGTGQYFALTLVDQATGLLHEIIYATARSTDTLTVTRGQEGTSALAWLAGDLAANFWTAGSAAAMVQVAQLQAQAGNYAIDTGAVNALAATVSPAPASLALITGAPFRVKVANTNTGSATLALGGLAATTIVNIDGSTLAAGELPAGSIAEFYYNGTNYQVASVNFLLSRNNTFTGTNVIGGVTFSGGGNASGNGTFTTNVLSAQSASIGGVSMPGGGGLTASDLISTTAVTAANGINTTGGNIVANAGRLRASLGAYLSGDANAACILNDFTRYVAGVGGTTPYLYDRLPDGLIIQTVVGVNSTGSDVITFPNAFANACMQVLAHEASPTGWGNPPAPTIMGIQNLTATNFALYVCHWTGSTFAFTGGIAYRYIAIGY